MPQAITKDPQRNELDGAACSMDLQTFDSPNGRMMEGNGGGALIDLRVCAGRRLSIFRSYTYHYMDQPNLTVLARALVTRIFFEKQCAIGVEVAYEGKMYRFRAGREVVLSLGAVQTPKVLLQSGVGNEGELKRWGIPLVEHRPGVSQNFQDHASRANWSMPVIGSYCASYWRFNQGLTEERAAAIPGVLRTSGKPTKGRVSLDTTESNEKEESERPGRTHGLTGPI